MTPRRPRRLPRALAASLLLHALLLAWVVWQLPSGPDLRGRQSRPIEIQMVTVPPPTPPPPVAVAPPPPPSKGKPPRRPAATAPTAAAPVAPSAQPAAPQATAAAAPAGERADTPRRGDAFLVPRVGTVLPGLGFGEESEAAGHTVKNGPGEEPDQAAVNEYVAERTKAKLDQQLGEMVADQARENGILHPYFTRLQGDLRAGFRDADVKLTKKTGAESFKENVVDTWVTPASRFGKTGNPLGADSPIDHDFAQSSFGRLLERGGDQTGDAHDTAMLQAGMQSMAAAAVMRESIHRVRLKTVLMLRQDGDGALAETTVLERSGDKEFDEFVLHLTRKVVRDQGDTEDDGGAPSALGWSSVWQFTWEPPEVKVKLLRVLKQQAQPTRQLQ